MINSATFFTIAYILNLFANYKNYRALIKDKGSLRGFSFMGSLCTFTVVLLATTGFLLMGNWVVPLLSIPSLIYWFYVTYYNKPIL